VRWFWGTLKTRVSVFKEELDSQREKISSFEKRGIEGGICDKTEATDSDKSPLTLFVKEGN